MYKMKNYMQLGKQKTILIEMMQTYTFTLKLQIKQFESVGCNWGCKGGVRIPLKIKIWMVYLPLFLYTPGDLLCTPLV